MATFPSIRIEGGLLGPDILDQLLDAELPGQKPADFGVDGKRSLTDEIAYLFADARSQWEIFQHRLEKLPKGDIATSATRDAWMIPFLGLLGYEPKYNQKAYSVDGVSFAVSHRVGEPDDSPPIHIVGAGQELGRVPLSGKPRMAPHSLLQEYLNRTEVLWGLVTNGLVLRLLRNTTLVRRQAYVEFDLQAIIEEKRFEDFAALYRLIHRTRLARGVNDARDSLLEKYYLYSEEQGGRVRDHLRDGVEECITRLANGFLSHPSNDDLRRRASTTSPNNERISSEELYRQLLRLVYRFLFLLVSEDRGVLGSAPLYRDHYGIARLRRLLDHRAAYTDNDDIWRSLRVLWLVLSDDKSHSALEGKPMASVLGLPVLNGDLFAPVSLDSLTISNGDLLEAFYWLAWYKDEKTRAIRRVNYAALDVEELGSVYESLIELHPVIDTDTIGRSTFSLLFGAGRKTTGTYYTPPQLVNELVKSALEPVLFERIAEASDKLKAILSIRVCDPACGSGHFLLAAARRLGKELARIKTGEDEPAPERIREAIRDVVSHCIYGVDKNPLAVDLCRVSLWVESYTAERPLTFLDHRIRCGDSLVGVFDLECLKDGIPDKAFDPLEGDDKVLARELTKINRSERTGQYGLFSWTTEAALTELTLHSREVDSISNDSPEDIRRKKKLFEQSHSDPARRQSEEASDLWTAAFYQWLKGESPAITTRAVIERLSGGQVDPRVRAQAHSISIRQRFFHWQLEFPEVFADGGFDVILSNPPWEHVELKEQEFFAARDARVATAPTKAERVRLIRNLKESNPSLYDEFVLALRDFDATRLFLGRSGRYPLTGRGRINTYAVFAELSRRLINSAGRSGIIVLSGIATDDTTKFFFQDLMSSGSLVSLYDFENRKKIFSAIDSRMKFCLLTCYASNRLGPTSKVRNADFVFFALDVDDLRNPDKRFTLTAEEIALLNPNTRNCPIFRTKADAELTKAIYRRVPVLWREGTKHEPEVNLWRLRFTQGLFNMAADSHHFRTATELKSEGYRLEGNVFVSPFDRYLPLYEAKMLHQFDHRWATYENESTGGRDGQIEVRDARIDEKQDPSFVVQPRYWLREDVVESTMPKYPEPLALALQTDHIPSMQRLLCWWAAGFYFNHGNKEAAKDFLYRAMRFEFDSVVARNVSNETEESFASRLERDFPLNAEDVDVIRTHINDPKPLAQEFVRRFSPKWLLGWRDICRSTDERTTISTALPKSAVGDTFLLMFSQSIKAPLKLALIANLNSLVQDYSSRQKVGGTHMKYNVFRQLPVLHPDAYGGNTPWDSEVPLSTWLQSRVLELIHTAHDLDPLVVDCGNSTRPFEWQEDRRFEIRCQLDAAFFHLYLTSEANGDWRMAESETPEQLLMLKNHFNKPRDAVMYILDQFPIVRQKEGQKYGRYRTKERILEIYDSLLIAQHDLRVSS